MSAAPKLNIFEAEFIPINPTILEQLGGALVFDVYVKRTETAYSKLFPRGEQVDRERVRVYSREKGVAKFYVTRAEYRQYLLFVEQMAARLMSNEGEGDPDKRVALLKEMVDLTLIEMMFEKHVDERTLAHASQTTQACIDILARDPKTLFRIFKMLSSHPYQMKHAMVTSVVSLILAKQVGLNSERTLKILGIGAMLHDLGMSTMSFDAETKGMNLTPEEWTEMRRHPELGKRLLDHVKSVPSEAKMILLQHHEQPNGGGYPNGLRDPEIFPLAKIVSIADSFSAMVAARPFRSEAFTPTEALRTMLEDRGKFDLTLMRALAKALLDPASGPGPGPGRRG